MLIFDDESENDWNRQKVLERLSQVTLPPDVQPQIGTDWSPVGQIYLYTLKSTNPQYDLMDLKSLEDWYLEKQFKSVPNVVDVVSFGGITSEYQVRVDPDKLIVLRLEPRPGGTATHQQQRQRGRQLHRSGNAADQRAARRSVRQRRRHRRYGSEVAERHADSRRRYRDRGAGAEDPPGPDRARPFTARTAGSSTTTTWWKASCCCAKAPTPTQTLDGHPRKGEGTERPPSATGREDRSLPRSQRPGALHHAHGAAQPDRGHHPGGHHSASCFSATCAAR